MKKLVLVAVLFLGGCVTQPPHETPSAHEVSQLHHWLAQGRIGITGVARSGSGNFRWQQQGKVSQVNMHGPLGAGSISVLFDDTLHITLSNGAHYDADAALDVLSAQLGAPIPVKQMSYWLRGIPAPGDYQWVEGADKVLQQSGWRIEYGEAMTVDGLQLPRKISATHDQARIRVVINEWTLQ